MFPFTKANPTRAAEAELATLEKRRTALQGKLEAAGAAVESARAARVETLISGAEDADLSVLDAKISAAESE
jgi:multidrug resistance efflux pump